MIRNEGPFALESSGSPGAFLSQSLQGDPSFLWQFSKYISHLQNLSSRAISARVTGDSRNLLKAIHDIQRYVGAELSRYRVLVLGCGYHYPEVIMWRRYSPHVVGLDVYPVFWRDGPARKFSENRKNGMDAIRSIGDAIYLFLYCAAYHRQLARIWQIESVEHRAYDLVSYLGERFPFPDSCFDLVFSNAVLEHVFNLDQVVREIKRVTKPSGISFHYWHNYLSFSGNHLPEAVNLKFPWGHLTGASTAKMIKTHAPAGYTLNKLRQTEIVDTFRRHLDDVEVFQCDEHHNRKGIDKEFRWEKEELLTDQIGKRLRQYDREELLTREYLVVGRFGR